MNAVLDNSAHAHRPLDVAGQAPRRQRERGVRQLALAFARWTGRLGLSRCRAADRLNLRPETLGRWGHSWTCDHLPARPLGRPRRLADPLQRLHVLQHLQQAGPTLGLPALRSAFPDQARSQLADLQREHRRQWFHDHEIFADVLEWLVPGSVWAGDFSQLPVIIEPDMGHVLAVRDLASRRQLDLLAAAHTDAATAVMAMEHLFITCGAPLVFKSDNGSPFIADDFKKLLARWQVIHLLSPAHWPPYNGTIEAGFGSAKTRIYLEAARHGRLDHWNLDDVEAARQLANCASRPWGASGPTPEERWRQRTPITPEHRLALGLAVREQESVVLRELELTPEQAQRLKRRDRAAVAREAISRALQQLGYLLVQRRRITPPLRSSFGAIIS